MCGREHRRTTSHIHLEHDIRQHNKKTKDLVEEVDKYVSNYKHMITKRASGKDVENDNRPHVGDLVAIVKGTEMYQDSYTQG